MAKATGITMKIAAKQFI